MRDCGCGCGPALSLSGMYRSGPQSAIDAAWSTTLDLAVQVGDPDYQLRAIGACLPASRGDFRAALGFAERLPVATDRVAV